MITDLTKEDAEYIGEKIDEIVPHEVDKDEEDFVLKIENEKWRDHRRMCCDSVRIPLVENVSQ